MSHLVRASAALAVVALASPYRAALAAKAQAEAHHDGA